MSWIGEFTPRLLVSSWFRREPSHWLKVSYERQNAEALTDGSNQSDASPPIDQVSAYDLDRHRSMDRTFRTANASCTVDAALRRALATEQRTDAAEAFFQNRVARETVVGADDILAGFDTARSTSDVQSHLERARTVLNSHLIEQLASKDAEIKAKEEFFSRRVEMLEQKLADCAADKVAAAQENIWSVESTSNTSSRAPSYCRDDDLTAENVELFSDDMRSRSTTSSLPSCSAGRSLAVSPPRWLKYMSECGARSVSPRRNCGTESPSIKSLQGEHATAICPWTKQEISEPQSLSTFSLQVPVSPIFFWIPLW